VDYFGRVGAVSVMWSEGSLVFAGAR
jgi:hypothetical protein